MKIGSSLTRTPREEKGEENNQKVYKWKIARRNQEKVLIKACLRQDRGRSCLHRPPHGKYLLKKNISSNKEGRMRKTKEERRIRTAAIKHQGATNKRVRQVLLGSVLFFFRRQQSLRGQKERGRDCQSDWAEGLLSADPETESWGINNLGGSSGAGGRGAGWLLESVMSVFGS